MNPCMYIVAVHASNNSTQSIREVPCLGSSSTWAACTIPSTIELVSLICFFKREILLTLFAIFSGVKFFASGDTGPPTLRRARWTSLPMSAWKHSSKVRWADLTKDREGSPGCGSFQRKEFVTKKDGAASGVDAAFSFSTGMAHFAVS